MKIRILGGKNEIGGNKILVEHKGTKILLDFGMSFGQAGKFFSEFLQPRKCNSLTDFYEFKLLPRLKGAYRLDYLKHMERRNESKGIDAVFLSHAHADHAQYIHFLRKDIPIHCTTETKIILKCLEETGSNPFSDLITACEAFTFYVNSKGGLSKIKRNSESGKHVRERPFRIMKPEEKVRIGSLEIEMVPVDHSLPGACGFIIYSDEGNLVYTGDIRFHGFNQELSKKFIEKAKNAKPKWILCEGTRIDQDEINSEEEVKKKISKIISESKGLVFVEHPIRDLDRVKSIYEATKENGREFVVNSKLAYLIQELGDLSPIKLEDVKIIIHKKQWGLISKEGIDQSHIEQEYDKWERPFINMENSMIASNLKENPEKYVVSMSIWEIKELIDIQPKNAIWIKSSCEPFCEDMELDEERKKNWLKHFKIKEYFAHASGHASGIEIKDMLKQINAEEVIPIHTEHRNMFK